MTIDTFQLAESCPDGATVEYWLGTQVYNANSAALENWTSGNYAHYQIALAQIGATKKWTVTRPALFTADTFSVTVRKIVDGAIANDVVLPVVRAPIAAVTLAATQSFNNTGQTAPLPISAAGSTARLCTVTIEDVTNNPLAGANVWISTDAAGRNLVSGTLVSDAGGHVATLLIPGASYYLWLNAAGQNPIVAKLFTAVAD